MWNQVCPTAPSKKPKSAKREVLRKSNCTAAILLLAEERSDVREREGEGGRSCVEEADSEVEERVDILAGEKRETELPFEWLLLNITTELTLLSVDGLYGEEGGVVVVGVCLEGWDGDDWVWLSVEVS